MITQKSLNAEEVHENVSAVLREHSGIEVSGYRCDSQMVIDVLVKAAVSGQSIEATSASLETVADSNTLREQLDRVFELSELRAQEAGMNAGLAASFPADLPHEQVTVAVDTHDEPFYGKTPLLLAYTCGGQARKGSSHFFRIASAYLVWRSARVTLAFTYVLPEDTTLTVVQRLWERLTHLGFRRTTWYLDKGFCNGAVLRFFQSHHQAAVLACPIRGKTKGTRALCKGRRSYQTTYTFTDGTTVPLVMVATLVPDASGRKRRKWLAFVLLGLNWSPRQVYQRYRHRFGIEASYRLLRQARLFTNSRNPAFRFFALALALLLQNVWVRLRWLIARIPAPGPICIDPTRFRFTRFKDFLAHAIELRYGLVMAVYALC